MLHIHKKRCKQNITAIFFKCKHLFIFFDILKELEIIFTMITRYISFITKLIIPSTFFEVLIKCNNIVRYLESQFNEIIVKEINDERDV